MKRALSLILIMLLLGCGAAQAATSTEVVLRDAPVLSDEDGAFVQEKSAVGAPIIDAEDRYFVKKGMSFSVSSDVGLQLVELYVKKNSKMVLINSVPASGNYQEFFFADLNIGVYRIVAYDTSGNLTKLKGVRVSNSSQCPEVDEHECEKGWECEICGGRAEHEYEDGECVNCGALCPNRKNHSCESACKVCGYEEEHDYLKGVCRVCGAKCPRTSRHRCRVACQICGYRRPHKIGCLNESAPESYLYKSVSGAQHEAYGIYEYGCVYEGCDYREGLRTADEPAFTENHEFDAAGVCGKCGYERQELTPYTPAPAEETPGAGDGWRSGADGTRYYRSGKPALGWLKLENDWFYLDAETGLLKTGWFTDMSGNWFYAQPAQAPGETDGLVATEKWMRRDGVWRYLKADGAMAKSEWVCVNRKWYYLNEDGSLLTNGKTPDGRRVGPDGAWTGK